MQESFVFDQTSTISMCALKNFSKNDLETVLKFMKWNLPSHYLCQFQVRPKYLGSSEEQDMDLSNIF